MKQYRTSPLIAPFIHNVDRSENPLLSDIYLVREDSNPFGSFKDRSFRLRIKELSQKGIKTAVLSTSGNAGIAAAGYGSLYGVRVVVVLSPKTPYEKVRKIKALPNSLVIISNKPMRIANYISVKYGIENIRPSKDRDASKGYEDLGLDMVKYNIPFDHIFSFVSSGSSFLGMSKSYREIYPKTSFHAVQMVSKDEITRTFDPRQGRGKSNNLGISKTPYKEQIVERIRLSQGSGWTVLLDELQEADLILKNQKVYSSFEGIAAFSAALRARRKGLQGKIAVVISGRVYNEKSLLETIPDTCIVHSIQDIQQYYDAQLQQFFFGEVYDDLTVKKTVSPIFFVVPDSHTAIGFDQYFENFYTVCIEDSPEIDKMKQKGMKIYCHDRDGKKPLVSHSARGLLKSEEVQQWIESKSEGMTPQILVFKNHPFIETICQQKGYKLLCSSSGVSRLFEDKIKILNIIGNDFSIPLPRTISEVPKDFKSGQKQWNYINKKDLLDVQFGQKDIVVQFAHGHAGTSTQRVSFGEREAFLVSNGMREMRFSEYIDGIPVTLNACIYKGKVFVGGPFFQITNQFEFNENFGGTAGNDFGIDLGLSEVMHAKIFSLVSSLGEHLLENGYKGFFGVDLIANRKDEHIYFIEINPRFTASVSLYTQLQSSSGIVPFSILQILGENNIYMDRDSSKYYWADLKGSQLIIRNITSHPIQIQQISLDNFGQAVDTIELQGLKKGEFLFRSKMTGAHVSPTKEIGSIQTKDSIINPEFVFKKDWLSTFLSLRDTLLKLE